MKRQKGQKEVKNRDEFHIIRDNREDRHSRKVSDEKTESLPAVISKQMLKTGLIKKKFASTNRPKTKCKYGCVTEQLANPVSIAFITTFLALFPLLKGQRDNFKQPFILHL